MALGVAAVHAVEVAGEESGLVAARGRPDLDDHVFVVELVFRDERPAELRLELLDARFVRRDLVAGELDELGVAALGYDGSARSGPCPGGGTVEDLDDLLRRGVLTGKRLQAVVVVGHPPGHLFFGAPGSAVQLLRVCPTWFKFRHETALIWGLSGVIISRG
jgi:hypothetical protein